MKEEKVIESKLLDSSVWLAYLLEGFHQEIIESETTIFISPLSIFEIKKKLFDKKIPENEIKEKMKFIKERSLTIVLDNKIAEKAVDISINNKIPAIDSLIYSTAILNNAKLITRDNDFRNLKNIELLE